MSNNLERIENVKQLVRKIEPDFNKLAKVHGAVTFERELSFAFLALSTNSYLMGVAMANQDSLKRAVLSVASVGLSLDPTRKLAYLLPRGKRDQKEICLEISYRGLIQIATDVGSILWAHADVVCEKDTFRLRGLGKEPLHEYEPFATDRGEVVGAYCVAVTPDNHFLTTVMSAAEIQSIRDRSEAFKAGSGPWITDRNEMIKKTVIRRAYKSWPMTDRRDRLDQAIEVGDDTQLDESTDVSPPPIIQDHRAESFIEIREILADLGKAEDEKYLTYLSQAFRREIKKLEDLTDMEVSQHMVMLATWQQQANKKKEIHENVS